jgi:hypothetical protein
MSKRLRKLLVLYRTLGFRRFIAKLGRRVGATVDTTHTELLFVKRLGKPRRARPQHNGLRVQPIMTDDEVFAFDYVIAPEYLGHGAAIRVLS